MMAPSIRSSLFRTGALTFILSMLNYATSTPDTQTSTSSISYNSFNLYRIPLAGMALFYSTNKSIGFNLTIIYTVLIEAFCAMIVNFFTIPNVCQNVEQELLAIRCFLGVANFCGSIFTGLFVVYVVSYYVKHPDFFRREGSGNEAIADDDDDEEQNIGMSPSDTFTPNEDVTAHNIFHPFKFIDIPTGMLLLVSGVILHLYGLVDFVSDIYSIRIMLFIYCLSRIINDTSLLVIILVKLLGREWEVSVHL
ncbi:hypothetical protein, no similarity [Maudiozyma barnettii]|uniref:Uncharacterized protein n=1 Tax=Maudiozyma barnettii TaxID=61262 RepID=A0A8H2ZJ42_9SACH|nr:hypothetical protein, no similarity [Kazachstania barnettii]CAB4256157.1 hypothetical protein, no similarity [Kazachstania barnettii]CAD1784765.1 hypothetical protein, no similarity [Kazachstania barnettii]